MKKAYIYCRVSTEEQATEGYSIRAQLADLEHLAAEQSYEVVETFLDEGFSGKDIKGRPELKRLLASVDEAKDIDAIIVHRIDRLSRNLSDALQIVDKMAQNNISFISYTENVNLDSAIGKMIFHINSIFAEYERKTISERVKIGMNERARNGEFNGGKVFGYDNVDKKLIINEKEAEIVRLIFSLACENKGYKKITSTLNESGLRTKRNTLFSIFSVKYILENPIYIGKIRYNVYEDWETKRRGGKSSDTILVDGIHEPIITLRIWDKAQELKKKRNNYVKELQVKNEYLASNFLKCPTCGSSMVGTSSNSYTYYTCINRASKGLLGCRQQSIKANPIDTELIDYLSKMLSKVRLTPVDNEPRSISNTKVDINELVNKLAEGEISVEDFEELSKSSVDCVTTIDKDSRTNNGRDLYVSLPYKLRREFQKLIKLEIHIQDKNLNFIHIPDHHILEAVNMFSILHMKEIA